MDLTAARALMFPDRSGETPTMRRIIFFAAVIGVVVAAAVYLGWRERALAAGSVTLSDGSVVMVEVAETKSTRELGLSGRTDLASGQGMLFLFPAKDRFGFWMKDMKFPIDIVWLEDGRVLDISPNTPVPPKTGPLDIYRPLAPVNQVLELPAGYAAAKNIRLGDRLTVSVDSSAAGR